MFIDLLAAAAAAAGEAPQQNFGFKEALEQGGPVAWTILAILVIQSVGSFYIMITKWLEQNKIMKEYRAGHANFWRASNISEGAGKFEKNSAWRQLVDDALTAESQHKQMTDSLEAHDWLHGSLARSESAINSKLVTPAASCPRCCSAWRPNATMADAPSTSHTPKIPHSSRNLSSSKGSVVSICRIPLRFAGWHIGVVA